MFIWTPPVCQVFLCAVGQARLQFYIRPCCRSNTCWPRWNPLTHTSFELRALCPNTYSGLMSPGLTCLPSYFVPCATFRRAHPFKENLFRYRLHRHSCRLDTDVTLFILPIACQQCPDRPRHLVGQRHRHHILRPAFAKLLDPGTRFLRVRQHCSGPMNQQRAQIRVPALADAQQLDAPAGARLLGYQPKLRGKFTTRLERFSIAHRRHCCCCGQAGFAGGNLISLHPSLS